MEDIIDRILLLIDNSGISESAMCKELGIGNGIIGKWRKGLNKPSAEAIRKIALRFDVTTDYLYFGTSPTFPVNITPYDNEWLSLIHQLPIEAQYEFRGEIKGYLKRLNEESAQAEKLRQAK
ncbi:MAG: helix-turn-helix transcriptional regulator [Lachnospiraceae bacterium]|nr:helix-turn-helix transcriptional regulator [Lachnospiraceae bacterium]